MVYGILRKLTSTDMEVTWSLRGVGPIVIVICKYDSDVNADKTIVTAVMKVILLYLLTKSVIKTKGSFRAGLLYTISVFFQRKCTL